MIRKREENSIEIRKETSKQFRKYPETIVVWGDSWDIVSKKGMID